MSVSVYPTAAPPVTENASSSPSPIVRIHEALNIVHSPYSSNSSRKDASFYLEQLKTDKSAPYHGFTLASDKSQEPVVRHYALSLLENAIRHKWFEYEEGEAEVMRGWVLQLSEGVAVTDPLYLRNKTAQLWVEIAKRSWANQWMDMDQLLLQLWSTGAIVHKEFVLFVLENLSEEVFAKEDGSAAMREQVLKKACVEIFTPAEVLQKEFPNRAPHPKVRFGEEGWLVRLCVFLQECIQNGGEESRSCAVRILAVFRSVMPWVVPKAIAAAHSVDHICQGLAVPDVKVQMASVEALHALYSRPYFTDEEYEELICPIFTTERVDLLRKIYEWSIIGHEDIDEEKYLLSKKLSEMISKLGNFLEAYEKVMPQNIDLPNLLNLFFSIVQNKSFVVAIPVLVTWTQLLRSEAITEKANNLIAPLLQLCSSRLVRYEQLPEDSEDPSLVLLLEDIDTIPERHAFLGNFRRYNVAVIEQIVRRRTTDAVYHILSQVWQTLEHLYDNAPPFSIANYSKSSPAILQVDGQFTVVEAALKGFLRGRDASTNNDKVMEGQKKMEDDFQGWCERLLTLNFDDPLIKRRVIQLVVQFATSALEKRPQFMFTVLESILMTRPVESPEKTTENRAYTDAVKELKGDAMHELQRLGTKMPDQLLEIYDELEAKINSIIASGGIDERQQLSYQTFLFTIIHRAKGLDRDARIARLRSSIDPVTQLWQNTALSSALQSFSGFMEILGMGKVNDYLVSRQVHNITDWGGFALDEEGVAIQTELTERVKALPLRPTKAFLGASTEKIGKETSTYEIACEIWKDSVPVILPDLLKYLEHAHAFNNPSNWAGLPQEMQGIVPRILTDRFWQAGISGGSKDDFFARVSGTKTTMEGLASSIRGTVRAVREAAYSVLFGLSRLDSHFYGFPGLPQPLAKALFTNAPYLSSNQLITLLGLAKCMVDECPPELRPQFIPPILNSCFQQIDSKITGAWEALAQRQQVGSDDDQLSEEMKAESLLRQLTNTAVMIVASLFDPNRANGKQVTKLPLILVYMKFDGGDASMGLWKPNDEAVESSLPIIADLGVTPGILNGQHHSALSVPLSVSPNLIVPNWLDTRSNPFPPPDTHPLDPSFGTDGAASKYPTIRRFCLSDATILEPLIVFSCHAIRMRDTRSCGVILRVFRSIVPEFANARDPDNQTNAGIREYISEEVLKASISSLHEPYYVDSQKDLAQLIATILVNYTPLTSTPRSVLLSLPGMKEAQVDQSLDFITRLGIQPRQQRAIVLDLLRDLKGQSINEMGRIQAPRDVVRKERSKMQEEFMMTEEQREQAEEERRRKEKTPELEGMAGMFGGQ